MIIGIHCGHNSSAALIDGGRIIGAVQEERFTKRKNQVAFPARAIAHLVKVHLGGKPERIERVAFATRDVDPIGLAVSRYSDFSVADHVREMHSYWKPVFYEGAPNDARYWIDMYRRGERLNRDHNVDVDALLAMPLAAAADHLSRVERPSCMRRLFGWEGPSEIVDHHTCHAYYAFYGSPIARSRWHEVLVLTADSWGDGRNWSAWTVNADGTLQEVAGGADHGVARIYRFATLILGMKPNEHEYKVMGLSAYAGANPYVTAAESVFREALDFEAGKFVRRRPLKDSYFDLKDRLEGHRFDHVSAALQNWSSDLTRAWAAHWLRATGKRILCFSGGLSMNIKANGDLMAIPQIDDMSVPASGGDESTSIGAAMAAAKRNGSEVSALPHVYLGIPDPDDPENDWRSGIARAGIAENAFAEQEGVDNRVLARLLAADHIVARVAGPMEFGARALGNRSILANPRNPENVKRINDAIKHRDFWMPFTPSILAEYADRYLVIPKGIVAPFMTIGYQTTALARRDIAGALHPGDFSARPQFVTRDANAGYWELISEFAALTGIGALLNTSLNLHGDPMNRSVADAARTLALSELDFLSIPGGRLIYKRRAQAALDLAIRDRASSAARIRPGAGSGRNDA